MLTALKCHLLHVNMYFTDQNIMQEGDSTELNFKGLEMQKWNISTDRAQRADAKNGVICLVIMVISYHQKWKDSLEGSLDRVLFAVELEFPKILVPRLPQHTSNVNIECAGKSEWSKQLYSLYLTSFLEHCIWICF